MMMLGAGKQKIRILSKKLSSGNYQVKFYVDSEEGKPYYGYLLVESGRKVSEVVTAIYERLQKYENPDAFYHGHLYSIGSSSREDPPFMIFQV